MSKVAGENRHLLEKRKAYPAVVDPDWDNDPVILGMVKALSVDVDDTIEFLGECTGEEFGWMSEIFAEIAEATRSPKLVDALYVTAERFPEECERLHLIDFIDEARDIVQED